MATGKRHADGVISLTVVSAFFRPPLKAGAKNVVQVGPLLRPELTGTIPTDGAFNSATAPFRKSELLSSSLRPV